MGRKALINDRPVNFSFQLKTGQYGISIFNDENTNDKLDTNWLGMPKEGAAASNNAKAYMGPPKFEDAKITFRDHGIWQTLRIVYF